MSIAIQSSTQSLFQANWPEHIKPNKTYEYAYNFFTLILPPLLVARLTCYALGKFAASYIIPASDKIETPPELVKVWKEKLISECGGKRFSFLSPDGVKLDGMMFEGQHRDKAIIYCPGMGGMYADSYERIKFLKESGATVLVFDRRGVGDSEGDLSAEGLELDVYSLYEYAYNKLGIHPESVLGYGYSMGGCDINRGAALVQKKYQTSLIKVVNERSFANLASTVRVIFGKGMVGRFFACFIRAIGWQMDSKSAWDSLRGRKCAIYHKLDKTIPYDTSLYKAIKKDNRFSVDYMKMQNPEHSMPRRSHKYHMSDLSLTEKIALRNELKKLLNIPHAEADAPIIKHLKVRF